MLSIFSARSHCNKDRGRKTIGSSDFLSKYKSEWCARKRPVMFPRNGRKAEESGPPRTPKSPRPDREIFDQDVFSSARVSGLRVDITSPTYVGRMAEFYDILRRFSRAKPSRESRAATAARTCTRAEKSRVYKCAKKDDGSFYYIVTRDAAVLRLSDW